MAETTFELAALSRVLPASLIVETLTEAGKTAKRRRLLPPELVTWLVIGMGLYRSFSIPAVLDQVGRALGAVLPWGPAERPHSTSIAAARDRLGWETIRLLFQKLARLLWSRHSASSLWRGLTVYTLDGTTLLVPDSPANDAWFGRPTSWRGTSGFPQVRALILMGAWNHLIAEVVLGPYRVHELKLAEFLVERLKPGALLLLDRAYDGFAWPARLHRLGLHFIVRLKVGRSAIKPTTRRRLGPSDWLGALVKGPTMRRRYADFPDEVPIRVITRMRKGYRPIVIVTNLTAHEEYPADEVAELYRDRWEAELGYRELKVHLADRKVTFRCSRPERVLQEAYGLLIAYNCTRALMCEAAESVGRRPTTLSFVQSLVRLRRHVEERRAPDELVAELARCQLPARRRGRRCDRAVKIKMSNYPRKRAGMPSAPTVRQRQGRRAHGLAG